MTKQKPNFLESIFNEEEKGRILQKDVQSFQEIERLKKEIGINVKAIIEQSIPPITSRLDQIYELLVKIGLKVDISAKEEEVLDLLKKELAKKT